MWTLLFIRGSPLLVLTLSLLATQANASALKPNQTETVSSGPSPATHLPEGPDLPSSNSSPPLIPSNLSATSSVSLSLPSVLPSSLDLSKNESNSSASPASLKDGKVDDGAEESDSGSATEVDTGTEMSRAADSTDEATEEPDTISLNGNKDIGGNTFTPRNSSVTSEDKTPVKDDLSKESQSDKVDYYGWKVFKVEGFKKSPVAVGSGGDNMESKYSLTSIREDDEDEFPLMDLEEHPGVRILQEHRREGFYHVAVSPEDLDEVISIFKSRGLTAELLDADLGSKINEVDSSFRASLPKGEVSFDSYMTFEQIEDFLAELAQRHSRFVKKRVIGKSEEGRDIHMLTLTLGGRTHAASRQVKGTQEITNVENTLQTLDEIIHWDARNGANDRLNSLLHAASNKQANKDRNRQEETDDKSNQEDQEGQEDEIVRLTPQNLENGNPKYPYGALMLDNSNVETIRNTLQALEDIISQTPKDSPEYVYLDYADQPQAVQLVYKVLQRIINYNQSNPVRRRWKSSGNARSLDVNGTEFANSPINGITDSDDGKDDFSFLLESFLPEEYNTNSSIVESVRKSIQIIYDLLPADGPITQEAIDELTPKLVNTSGIVGITSGGTENLSNTSFFEKLSNILRLKGTAANLNNSTNSDDEDEDANMINYQRRASGKPIILVDGGIHAREWISPAFVMYMLTRLVADTSLLLGAEWRLIPVLNPDGYVHTWTKDRLWRKNRSNNRQTCPGVDLNRNFGYKFGGAGTSSRACSEVFRGPHAFSELESQALRREIIEAKDRLQAYVSVHSYGQMILHPWGHSTKSHPRHDQLKSVGEGMAAAIKAVHGEDYQVGSAAQILYSATGGSDDWVSSQGVPFSFTFELRDKGHSGFILPSSLIRPTVEETWSALEYLGNRIIQENPRSEVFASSNTTAVIDTTPSKASSPDKASTISNVTSSQPSRRPAPSQSNALFNVKPVPIVVTSIEEPALPQSQVVSLAAIAEDGLESPLIIPFTSPLNAPYLSATQKPSMSFGSLDNTDTSSIQNSGSSPQFKPNVLIGPHFYSAHLNPQFFSQQMGFNGQNGLPNSQSAFSQPIKESSNPNVYLPYSIAVPSHPLDSTFSASNPNKALQNPNSEAYVSPALYPSLLQFSSSVPYSTHLNGHESNEEQSASIVTSILSQISGTEVGYTPGSSNPISSAQFNSYRNTAFPAYKPFIPTAAYNYDDSKEYFIPYSSPMVIRPAPAGISPQIQYQGPSEAQFQYRLDFGQQQQGQFLNPQQLQSYSHFFPQPAQAYQSNPQFYSSVDASVNQGSNFPGQYQQSESFLRNSPIFVSLGGVHDNQRQTSPHYESQRSTFRSSFMPSRNPLSRSHSQAHGRPVPYIDY